MLTSVKQGSPIVSVEVGEGGDQGCAVFEAPRGDAEAYLLSSSFPSKLLVAPWDLHITS